jgi:hypothetical protein
MGMTDFISLVSQGAYLEPETEGIPCLFFLSSHESDVPFA